MTVKPHQKEHRPAGQAVELPFDEIAVLEVTRFETGAAAVATAVALLTVSAFAVVLGPAVVVPAMPKAP